MDVVAIPDKLPIAGETLGASLDIQELESRHRQDRSVIGALMAC